MQHFIRFRLKHRTVPIFQARFGPFQTTKVVLLIFLDTLKLLLFQRDTIFKRICLKLSAKYAKWRFEIRSRVKRVQNLDETKTRYPTTASSSWSWSKPPSTENRTTVRVMASRTSVLSHSIRNIHIYKVNGIF